MSGIGRIERVQLRSVWPHEAHDFTRWLCDNLDVLGDAIGRELVSGTAETPAGSFSADIHVLDAKGNRLIVENQLGRSDHDHLGKVITYKAVLGAAVAVWIVGEPRPEHVSAISHLNETTGEAYYLLKIEAVRIGQSVPAPLLTLITGPSDEIAQVAATRKDESQRGHKYQAFWGGFLEGAATHTAVFHGLSAPANPFLTKTAGLRELSYNVWAKRDGAWLELRIDGGKGSEADNDYWLRELEKRRANIEAAFGDDLLFHAPGEQRVRGVRWYSSVPMDIEDPDTWGGTIESIAQAAERLEVALRPVIVEIAAAKVIETPLPVE